MKVTYTENGTIKTRSCDYAAIDGDKNLYLVYKDGIDDDANPCYRTITLNPGSVILTIA